MKKLLLFFLFIYPMTTYAQIERQRINIVTNKNCKYSEYVLPDKVDERKQSKVSWTGKCKSGYINGFGTTIVKGVNGVTQTTTVNYELGLENGDGEEIIESSKGKTKITGTFINGEVNGKATVNAANGNVYEGDFLDGKITGSGTLTFTNGNVYEGDFLDGKMTGKGNIKFANGNIYEGDVLDNKMTGKGIFKNVNGARFSGDFLNNQFTGVGEIKYPNGVRDGGNFLNGKLNGNGSRVYANGNSIEANFIEGKPEGKFKLVKDNGDILEGNIIDDKLDGTATYTKPNGDKWYQEYRGGVKISETPSSSNSSVASATQPESPPPDANRRQKGIDSMNCDVYAQNMIANEQPVLKNNATAILSGVLMGMSKTEYYNTCMTNLGW